MSPALGSRFIVGINQAWFGGQYDHDLGYNQFSILRLYNTPVPDPSLPDPSPALPYISSNPDELEQFFQNAQTEKHHLQVVRVWTFERFEGLQFDDDLLVVGLDGEFLSNLKKLLDTAEEFDMSVYLCLLDSWSIYGGPPQDLTDAGKAEDYLNLQDRWKQLMRLLVKDGGEDGREKFLNNALRPMLNAVGDHPALFAIDLMNEPEGLIQNDPSITITDIMGYITSCADFIHEYNSSIKVSCGFQHRSTAEDNTESLLPYLDFFDFHEYNGSGVLAPLRSSDFAGKPCIVGECGYPVGGAPDDPKAALQVLQNFLQNAQKQGYACCLAWLEDYPNKDAMLRAVKDFADGAQALQPGTKKKGS